MLNDLFWGNGFHRGILQSSHNPLAQSSGQVKLDSDEWKLWKNLFLNLAFGQVGEKIKAKTDYIEGETWDVKCNG